MGNIFETIKHFADVVYPKDEMLGHKMDANSPDWGWMDLKGILTYDFSGINAPTVETYKTGVQGLAYNASDVQRWTMHVEHWNIKGGNKYLHAHIRHNGTVITGDMVITFVIAYNYGHNRVGSPAPITKTLTVLSASIAATLPQYDTYISDILIAQSGGGVGLFDSDLWLPDDDIMINMTVTTLPTITGGTTPKLFIPYCDIHLQSKNLPTKNRTPNFYL